MNKSSKSSNSLNLSNLYGGEFIRLFSVVLMALMLMPFASVKAQVKASVTVNAGTNTCTPTTSDYIPFRGYMNDLNQTNEFIIPYGFINQSGSINSMTFYLDNVSDFSSGYTFDGTYTVFLFNLKQSKINHSGNNFVTINNNGLSYDNYNASGQVVYQGPLTASSDGTVTINFGSNFYYNQSASLLVGIYSTAGSGGKTTRFIGVDGSSSCYPSYYTEAGLHQDGDVGLMNCGFCPKTTFNFAGTVYSLTVGTSTIGGGTGGKVQVNGGTAYSGSKSFQMGSGTVTLKAIKNSGYTFTGWRLGSSTGTLLSTDATYDYSYAGTSNVSVYAVFENNNPNYTITAVAGTHGHVCINNGSWTTSSTSQSIASSGGSCTLHAESTDGCYSFTNWTITGTNTVASTNADFIVSNPSANASYTANFSLDSYTVSTSKNPSDGGTVSGAGSYNCGSTCTLTATPSTGYYFVNWTKDDVEVSTSASYSFTVSAETEGTYVANFRMPVLTYSSTASGTFDVNYEWENNTVNVNSGDAVPVGAVVNLSFTLDDNVCNNFTSFGTSDGHGTFGNGSTSSSTSNPTTFTMGAGDPYVTPGDVTITVWTNQPVHVVTAEAYPAAGGTVLIGTSYPAGWGLTPTEGATSSGNAICGMRSKLTAHPATGYRFVNWTVDGVEISTDAVTPDVTDPSAIVVSGPTTYVANFAAEYTVTYDKNSLTATGEMSDPNSPYTAGSTVTVLYNDYVFAGRVFEKWNTAADGSGTDYYPEDTFTISGDMTLYAQWIVYEPHLWTEFVTECPDTDSWEIVNDTILIKDELGLAWFISYVNGFNNSEKHSQAKAKLCADVDMSEHIWVPIGFSNSRDFYGYFDGQCYSIDGIHIANRAEADCVENFTDAEVFGVDGQMFYVGLFGKVDGTSSYQVQIKNTFVTSGTLYSWRAGSYVGSVAGAINETTLEFCEGAAIIDATDGISVGGIVGDMIHDSYLKGGMGVSTINTGATNAGGIAGAISDVSLNNELSYVEHSFANSDINESSSESYKIGAVVGHFYGSGFADPVYVHPDASGANNMMGDRPVALIAVSSVDKTARGYAYNSAMKYQLLVVTGDDIPITPKAVYTSVAPITYTNHDSGNKVTIDSDTKTLCDELNSRNTFVDGSTLENLGLHWDRVYGITAINGDYPILYPRNKVDGRVMAVAQRTGEKAIRYGSVNDLIKQCNANPDGGTIYMYQTDTIRVSTNANVVVYVNDTVALMQEAATVNAVVGIVMDNSEGNGDEDRDWHMFSPSISGGKTGILYGAQTPAYSTADQFLSFGEGQDYWLKENDGAVYFPNGISTVVNPGKQFDLYAYYEPQYHWINLKRAHANHWHQDEINGTHPNITYTETDNDANGEFKPGKGYMLALGNNDEYNDNLMQAKGVLNNGTVEATVTSKGPLMKGYNLIGNPYQSYLDFNKFANLTANASALWNGGGQGYKAYLIYDAAVDGFRQYLADDSDVSYSFGAADVADQYINMHQGFFVVKNTTTESATVTFTNNMRVTDQTPHFRDAQPTYPLVNLFCTDSDGKHETAIMEFERPSNAGALKMKGILSGKGQMYIHWNDDDLGSVFIDYMPDYVPIWFDAVEDGVFTMTWSTANEDFGYMHLIDNMAGADIDCLANDSYTFEAHVNDMSGRFRLVFKPLGIEEETIENSENFAFFNGNELVVNGEGELSLIDLNGRVLQTQYVAGQQSIWAMPKVAVGMYMLRLSNANDVKVQKIVIRK